MKSEYQINKLQKCKRSYETWMQEEYNLCGSILPWAKELLIEKKEKYSLDLIYGICKGARHEYQKKSMNSKKYNEIKKQIDKLTQIGV